MGRNRKVIVICEVCEQTECESGDTVCVDCREGQLERMASIDTGNGWDYMGGDDDISITD